MMMCGVVPVIVVLGVLGQVLSAESISSENVEGIQHLLTDAEKHAVASVDGDPDFIVGVHGIEQPLCFRVEGENGDFVRLLQDPDTGVVVNARISRPVEDSRKTYLSAVLIARRNFRLVARVRRVLVNRYKFQWGPVTVRLVHGHRVLIAPTLLALTLRNKNVTLVVKRHVPEGRPSPEIDENDPVRSADSDSQDGEGGEFADNASTLSWAARGTAVDHGPNPPGDDASVSTSETRGHQTDAPRSQQRRRRGHRRRGYGRGRGGRGGRQGRRRTSLIGDTPATSRAGERGDTLGIAQSTDNGRSAADTDSSRTAADMTFQRERRHTASSRQSRSRGAGDSSRRRQSATDGPRGEASASGSDVTAASVSPRELAAYVGFYVSDARDLSTETHGLLGQFLHKSVELQRARRKANGVVKARFLVRQPRPHHVKATLRTRFNLALNTSSHCWWLRDGGRGVVDGTYADYLVPRMRVTDMLPLHASMMSQ
ncbi:hypothetical protein BaRGS_00030166 [Batillaria attramentaria]|uniref:Inter-alpha-trypsin inhibitor heavy chain C-terminal domain-containing protein n=1 Tax=Batillaria attramentaria TaxID=370345 RepID=A0ABD0JU53_9CAEN